MNNVVIVSAVRTAIGKFGGNLKEFSPAQLGSLVLKDALKRAGVEQSGVDEVIMGNALGRSWSECGKAGSSCGRHSC